MNAKLITILSFIIIFIGGYTFMQTKTNHIPLDVIIGLPETIQPRISPDGKQLAWLKKKNDILNVYVKNLKTKETKQVTTETKRPIISYAWQQDSAHVLYTQDKDGDENDKLYQTSIETGKTLCLTPFENIKVELLAHNKENPNIILAGINKENPAIHDVYSINLETKEVVLIEKNPGSAVGFYADHSNAVKCRRIALPDGFTYQYKNNDGLWKTFAKITMEESYVSDIFGFSLDNNKIYFTTSKDSDTSQLRTFDLKTEKETVLTNIKDFDIASVSINPITYDLQSVAYNAGYPTRLFFDKVYEQHVKHLKTIDSGNPGIVSADNENMQWIVAYNKDNGPISYYLYNTNTQKADFLFYNKPKLNEYQLASMKPIAFTSRDGFTIHGYITYPVNSTDKKVPLILNVHGGPWAQDNWGYDPEAQWFANRGFACLQVNYRASTGYGKTFMKAGYKQWSKNMHNDLIDAVKWARSTGRINNKVGIYGGSYGGYATLVGLSFTPDFFDCGVDIVGPSNLVTFIESFPPYWKIFLDFAKTAIGDPETEHDFLVACSPLFKVDKITKPLFIAQGGQDQRVKQQEAEQIVAALKKHSIDHEYVLYKDEGHGFLQQKNRIDFYTKAEAFLKKHLT